MKIIILLILAGVLMAALLAGQQRMIYYPRRYGDKPQPLKRGQAVKYTTSQGRQIAYYLPPAEDSNLVPPRLWLMWGGNAALALDWQEMLEDFPDQAAGFLLLDYPGYGSNQGRPGPGQILESAEEALLALARHLEIDSNELAKRLLVVGHSLGAAAALLYASHHPVARIVLISPFTTLKAMARLIVGPLLAHTLFHDYDNRARLKEILSRQPPPEITIFHGDHDKIVPVEMGRELAALSGAIVYRELARGDHNYILVTARDEIVRAMVGGKDGKLLGE